MGKKIKVQRWGRGTLIFKASKTNKTAPVKYPAMREKIVHGSVTDRARAVIRYLNSIYSLPLIFLEIE